MPVAGEFLKIKQSEPAINKSVQTRRDLAEMLSTPVTLDLLGQLLKDSMFRRCLTKQRSKTFSVLPTQLFNFVYCKR